MAKNKYTWLIWVAIVVVVAYFVLPGFQDWVDGIIKPGPGTTPSTPTSPWEGKCLEHDAITMTIGPALTRYAPGTAVASNQAWHRVFVNEIDKGLKADSTTMTVSFDDDVCIYYFENTSGAYGYAAESCFTVPCKAAFSTAEYAKNDEHKMVAAKNATVTIFNDDDSLKNSAANNETLTTDDESTMGVDITFPGLGGFSPYGDILFNVFVNNSQFDDVTMSDADGNEMPSVSASTYRTKTNSTAGYIWYAFELPGREGKAAIKRTYYLTFDSASTGISGTTALGANVSVQLDDEDWFRHSKTGEMILSSSDDSRADTGYTNPAAYKITFRGAS